MTKLSLYFIAIFTALVPTASIAATLGSLVINDAAFADNVSTASGSPSTFDATVGFPAGVDTVTISDAGSGSNIEEYIYCTAACSLDVFFLDNLIVNGAGSDLVVFEAGANENMSITANGLTLLLDTSLDVEEAGFVDAQGFQVGYWLVDLTDFGIAAGGTLSSFQVDLLYDPVFGGDFASADFSGAAALNSVAVPVPGTLPLLFGGIALVGIVATRKRLPQ